MLTSRIWNPLTMAQEFFSSVLDTFETSFGDEHTTKKTPSNHCKYWSSRKRRHNLMNGRNVCVVLVVVLIRVTDVWWSKSSHFQYQTSEAERSPFRQTCSFSVDEDTGLVTLCSFRCVCVMFFLLILFGTLVGHFWAKLIMWYTITIRKNISPTLILQFRPNQTG